MSTFAYTAIGKDGQRTSGTLAADTRKGTRAGFSVAAAPEEARRLFAYLLERAHSAYAPVSAGVFGAHMQVALVNDGPFTIWLELPPA